MDKATMKRRMMRALASYVYGNESLSLENVMSSYFDKSGPWTEAESRRWAKMEGELSQEFFRRSGESD